VFFEPYINGKAGVVCRDGGLNQNNPVATAFSESKAIWGNDTTFDIILSLGSGQAGLPPERLASTFIVVGWLATLFEVLMSTFNGEEAWASFHKIVENSVKAKARRLNVHFNTKHEPALDDVASMGWMKDKANKFKFYNERSRWSFTNPHCENLDQEIAINLRASLFFFHPTSIKFNQNRSVAVVEGAIYSRVDSNTVPFRELVLLTEGFEIPGPFVPMPPLPLGEYCQPEFILKIAFQHDTRDPNQEIHLRVKFKDGYTAAISGFPTLYKVSLVPNNGRLPTYV
jgi:hypothetical protein